MANTNEDYEQSLPPEHSIGETIEAFRGILDVFPEDMGALESIFEACVQGDRKEDALKYGLDLAERLGEQGDWKRVRNITGRLLEMGIDDERVEVLHQNAVDVAGEEAEAASPVHDIEAPVGEGEKPASGAAPEKTGPATLKRDLSGELDLAWMLLQNEVITEEQYEKAISGLTESQSSSKSTASICLLQELASIDRVKMDRVLGFLSAETNTPFIDIDRFELSEELIELIPLQDARRYGIVPFGVMKDELMVATLNPVDENVRTQVHRYFGRRIHFFLCAPDALQSLLDGLESQKKAAK